jgi:hypothetical protein
MQDPTMNEQQPVFVQASTLLQHSNELSPQRREPSSPSPLTLPPRGENAVDSTKARSSSFIPTPPCLQSRTSNPEASEPVSRQSTKSTLEITSSSSLLCSNDVDIDHGEDKLGRILTMVQDVVNRCRICWASREVSRPHGTFRCPTRICSGSDWQTFKSDLQFPKGVVCYFCLAPYGPPFNHTSPSGYTTNPRVLRVSRRLEGTSVYPIPGSVSAREGFWQIRGPSALHVASV